MSLNNTQMLVHGGKITTVYTMASVLVEISYDNENGLIIACECPVEIPYYDKMQCIMVAYGDFIHKFANLIASHSQLTIRLS